MLIPIDIYLLDSKGNNMEIKGYSTPQLNQQPKKNNEAVEKEQIKPEKITSSYIIEISEEAMYLTETDISTARHGGGHPERPPSD